MRSFHYFYNVYSLYSVKKIFTFCGIAILDVAGFLPIPNSETFYHFSKAFQYSKINISWRHNHTKAQEIKFSPTLLIFENLAYFYKKRLSLLKAKAFELLLSIFEESIVIL